MSFTFTCPKCGQIMQCEDEWRGMQVVCPGCQQTVTLPAISPAEAAVPVAPMNVDVPQNNVPQQPVFGAQPASTYGMPGQAAFRPPFKSHLAEAILATILCFIPTGIVAIVFASIANGLYNQGKIDEAFAKAKTANIMVWVSVGVGLVIALLWTVGNILINS